MNNTISIEKILINSIFFNPLTYESLKDRLQPHHFSSPFNGQVWGILGQLHEAGMPLAAEFVANRLKNGEQDILDIISTVPVATGLEHYAQEIRDAYFRRMEAILLRGKALCLENQNSKEIEKKIETKIKELVEEKARYAPKKSFLDTYRQYRISTEMTKNLPETIYLTDFQSVPKGTNTMFFGDPGKGKTLTVISLLNMALAQGRAKRVIVLDLDMGARSSAKRGYDELADFYGEGVFDYFVLNHIEKTPTQILDDLVADNGDWNDTVVVYDNGLSFVWEDKNENVQAFFQKINQIREKGATNIIIHHTRKLQLGESEGAFFGTQAWQRNLDYQFLVDISGIQDDIFLWKVKKNRNNEIQNMAVRYNQDNTLTVVDFESANIPRQEVELIKCLKQILKDFPNITQKDLIAESQEEAKRLGYGQNRLHKIIKKYEGKEWEAKKDSNNASLYSLVEKLPDSDSDIKNHKTYKTIKPLEMGIGEVPVKSDLEAPKIEQTSMASGFMDSAIKPHKTDYQIVIKPDGRKKEIIFLKPNKIDIEPKETEPPKLSVLDNVVVDIGNFGRVA